MAFSVQERGGVDQMFVIHQVTERCINVKEENVIIHLLIYRKYMRNDIGLNCGI